MEMKNYNIKGQKDTQEKKKGKWQMFIVEEKKILEFLGVRKILLSWFNLIQFCCVWILAFFQDMFSLETLYQFSE